MRKRKKKQVHKPLTDQQKEAARLLFDCHKVGETAAMIGVHRCTIWRWCKRPDFQKEVDRIATEYYRELRKKRLREYHQSPEYKKKKARQANGRTEQ